MASAGRRRSTPGGKSSSYQQKLAVHKQRIPNRPELEIGKIVHLLGKDWGLRGDLAVREFKCFVSEYDPQHKWQGKQIPQGSLTVKCAEDAYTEEEAEQYRWPYPPDTHTTQLDLVNYGRLRHIYLSKNPTVVNSDRVNAAEKPAGFIATPLLSNKQTSRVYLHVRPIKAGGEPPLMLHYIAAVHAVRDDIWYYLGLVCCDSCCRRLSSF